MKCKFCKEDIIDGAIKCKHCGSQLNSDSSKNEVPMAEMKFCSGCGKKIHKTSSSCPHCGSQQTDGTNIKQESKKIGYAITSLVLGILIFLPLMGNSILTKDSIIGGIFISILGIIFGITTISKKYSGRGMAITGIILSSLSLFAMFGFLSKLN